MITQHSALLAVILALAGCNLPQSTPLFGAWQGNQPGADPLARYSVDLVLEGTPDAQSGAYRIATALHDPSARADQGMTHWGGVWVRGQSVINGQSVTTLRLNDNLPREISSYALLADGSLHVLAPDGTLDTSPLAPLYVLSPVPPGPRRGRV